MNESYEDLFRRLAIDITNAGVIPLNGERNLLLKIGNVVFVDSCQFLETSLDELVKSMRKSGLQDDFVHTTRHFGRNELFLKRGIYPYEHMTYATKFDETKLPANSAFYNRLRGEHVSEKKHERAKEIWAHFAMKTLQEYHTFYLVLDVFSSRTFSRNSAARCSTHTDSTVYTYLACRASRCSWR